MPWELRLVAYRTPTTNGHASTNLSFLKAENKVAKKAIDNFYKMNIVMLECAIDR